MKIQDIIFLVILTALIFRRKPKELAWLGLFLLLLSIPLFYFWVFFTAQRLVYYAAALFLIGAIILFQTKGK